MASLAPTRFATQLDADGSEHLVYWETTWVPTSMPGMYVQGDQTVLSADGTVRFLDCHLLPGSRRVYPFGDWPEGSVAPVCAEVAVEEHGTGGAQGRVVTLGHDAEGRLYFEATEGTARVVTA